MSIVQDLEKIGIIPRNQLKIEEKNYIAKQVADKLSTNIKKLSDAYNELYMRIFNCEMYYAEVDSKFYGVFYYYKNNTIYIDSEKDISNIDCYIMHECIHYLQNFSKISKDSNRAGVCQFMEFKIFGLGINEALVQYITAKSLGNKIIRVNNDVVTICTNSGNYYKYMTSLIAQILFLMGEREAVESCIYSTDGFENELYNTFEENTEKIVKNFDIILDENNKKDRDENKIIDIYMQTQQLIYTTYFSKMCKRLTDSFEVDQQVQKLEDYSQMVGRRLATTEEDFTNFKSEMDSQFLKKYIEVNRRKSNNSLAVIYRSLLQNIWSKITNFIQNIIVK
ncbi:MAG: hypothetical protein ACI4VQ_02735 [Clostridia bacterium]